jgi:hypothetical protein
MDALDHDFNGVANCKRSFALDILLCRNDAFGLVTKVDQHTAIRDSDDLSFDQVAGVIDGLFLFEAFEDGAEINFATLLLERFLGQRCRRFCYSPGLNSLSR